MRTPALFRCLLPVLSLITPLVLHGQFQEPAKDELQMTSDPKAPGAAAVYLNYEESTDDTLHYKMVYARIKVLSEKAKDLATVEVYSPRDFKVSDVHARTIHGDGTVIPLVTKPEDLLAVKTGERRLNRVVFNLPSVQVGSILEYRYQIRYDDNLASSPQWVMQQDYFVHKAHYSFRSSKEMGNLIDSKGNSVNRLIYWANLPPGVQVKRDLTGLFTVDLTDIPARPDEAYMPPLRTLLFQVMFYYQSAFDWTDFWNSEAKHWSKEVDHFAEPTGPIKDAVAHIVSPTDSDLEKAKKLYAAVQALDNTDFSREKGKRELKQMGLKAARRAEDTWAQKSGSRDDIALLYLSMLRAAGINAWALRVVNRDRSLFAPGYLWWDQLDDNIIIAKIGEQEMTLDPGEKMCPFSLLHWKHAGVSGMRQTSNGITGATTGQLLYTRTAITRTGDVTLDEQGGMKGAFRFVMTGQEALHWRQLALTTDMDEVKKAFNRHLHEVFPDGVDAQIDHFLGLDDENSNLMAVVNAQGTLGAATSKRILLPAFFFQAQDRQPFVQAEKRISAIDMHYPDQVIDQVVYHLPAGAQVEGMPADTKVPWADKCVLVVKVANKPGEVTVVRSFARGFTFLEAAKYQELRSYYQQVAQIDQQQLVVTLSPPTAQKGN